MFQMLLPIGFALLPAVLPPLLVALYFRRFDQRKLQIAGLLSTSWQKRALRRETDVRREEWKNKLDLDLAAYLYPTGIASVLTAFGTLLVFARFPGSSSPLPDVLVGIARNAPASAVAGFAGAYLWSLYDLVDRFRVLNLPVGAVHLVWFRLIFGPLLGTYVQQLGLFGATFSPISIFMIMAFPVADITKWLRDFASQRFSIGGPPPTAPPLWELVQGLTPDVINRLNEVGVSNVEQLASQDPIELLRKTNLEWRTVLDMMDQAYLVTYVGDKITNLRAKGVRGAIEAAILWGRLQNARDPKAQATAGALILSLATDFGTTEDAVKNLLQNLWEDPQVDLIWSLWFDRDMTPADKTWDGTPIVPAVAHADQAVADHSSSPG
jgi:hypothetical protein